MQGAPIGQPTAVSVPTVVLARCTAWFAPNAAIRQLYRSCPAATDPSTAAIASVVRVVAVVVAVATRLTNRDVRRPQPIP